MELRFAVVEDRLPDAQRLESLLRLAFGGGHWSVTIMRAVTPF